MLQKIDLQTSVGGAAAELALPAGDAKAPGILIAHEWWGLNDQIRDMAARFASEGFIAVALDLFGGNVTTDPSVAMRLTTEMKTSDAIQIMTAAAAAVKAHPRSNGHVAVTGFCLGGGMALAAACNVPGLSAVVPFYGTPRDEYSNGWMSTVPILGHYATEDPFVQRSRVESIAKAVRANGGSFELHLYDAGHAFMRATDPGTYNAEAATAAWQRTMSFLRGHLVAAA